MKLFLLCLPAVLFAAGVSAADLSPVVAEAAKYESGNSAEPLRQLERALRESAGNPAQRAEVEAALVTLLAPSATFEARRFACTQLVIIGTDASLQAIAELLKNPETTGIACLALGANPSPKVNDLLRAALAGSEGRARVQLIETLGDRRDTAAVKPLAELARNADQAAAEAAIAALGKIADEAALQELAALRRDGPPAMARAAALASLTAGDNVARSGNQSAATAVYGALLEGSQLAYVRRAAFEGLLRLDADGGEQRVLSTLRGQDATLKPSAIVHVRTLKSPGASAKFAGEMAALTPAERVQMIESLAARNDAAARAAIAGQLLAEEAAVRRAAVVAFAEIGNADSVPLLAKALGQAGTAPEQQTLELALASLKGGQAVDARIIALLKAGDAAPKASLINVLSRRGSKSAVPALLEQAGSADAAVAGPAFRALGKLAGPDQLPALMNALVALKAPAARGDAGDAVAKVLERVPEVDRRTAVVTSALAKAADVETRCALIGLLPVCGGARAFAAVNAARADQEAPVREAAFRALTAWPEASAIDTLLEIAQSGSQNTQRVLALRGCVRLLASANEYTAQEVAARFQKAMAAARKLNEGKLVLGGLANVHDPLALKLVEPFLNDPEMQAEAALAATRLAPYLCGIARDPARATLQKVIALPLADKALQQSARDLLAVINRFEDFIMAWQVAGPFAREGKDGQALFDVEFPPEQSGAAGVKWQLMPAGQSKARPWQLDLGALYGGVHRVAYARTCLYSETQQPARLEFGSDDGLKAWCNGQVVLNANRGGDVAPAAEKVAVTLKQGPNPLLLKVTQWTAGWGFCARVAKPDGSPIPGVRIELEPAK